MRRHCGPDRLWSDAAIWGRMPEIGGYCMKRIWLALAAALASAGFAAQAQDVDCVATTSQNEMTLCAEQDWNAADADLNTVYKQAMAVLKDIDANLPDGEGANFLRQAQRDWITFRDNACAAEAYPMHGGTAEPMVIYGCRARLTRERTEGLSYIADNGQ